MQKEIFVDPRAKSVLDELAERRDANVNAIVLAVIRGEISQDEIFQAGRAREIPIFDAPRCSVTSIATETFGEAYYLWRFEKKKCSQSAVRDMREGASQLAKELRKGIGSLQVIPVGNREPVSARRSAENDALWMQRVKQAKDPWVTGRRELIEYLVLGFVPGRAFDGHIVPAGHAGAMAAVLATMQFIDTVRRMFERMGRRKAAESMWILIDRGYLALGRSMGIRSLPHSKVGARTASSPPTRAGRQKAAPAVSASAPTAAPSP